MSFIFGILALGLLSPGAGAADTAAKLENFFAWLEQHRREFAACEPRKEKGDYVLCDNTRVPAAELKRLFRLAPGELTKELEAKGLKISIFCSQASDTPHFGGSCTPIDKLTDAQVDEALRIPLYEGRYFPERKEIVISGSNSAASLLQEWLHALQAGNKQPIYGRVYGRERDELEAELRRHVKKRIDQAVGRPSVEEMLPYLKQAAEHSDTLRRFSFWRDLIDERGVLQLFSRFGDEFNAMPKDILSARNKLRALCRRHEFRALLTASQRK